MGTSVSVEERLIVEAMVWEPQPGIAVVLALVTCWAKVLLVGIVCFFPLELCVKQRKNMPFILFLNRKIFQKSYFLYL